MINYVLQDKKYGKFGFMKVCFSQMCLRWFIPVKISLLGRPEGAYFKSLLVSDP